MIALSLTGQETGNMLKQHLENSGMEVSFVKKSKYIEDSMTLSLDEWTAREFPITDVMIWVCACGIAVRHIAPYLKSKKTDPAVIVMDECGKFGADRFYPGSDNCDRHAQSFRCRRFFQKKQM